MKVKLRALEPADADFMFDIENDSQAWRYSDTVAPLSRRILRDYALGYDADPFRSGQLRLVVTDASFGTPVGLVDLYEISQRHSRAFIGIYILPAYRRKGYAHEAIKSLCNYASQILFLHQLGTRIGDDNPKSICLFEKCGFSLTATLPDWLRTPSGNYIPLRIMIRHLQ